MRKYTILCLAVVFVFTLVECKKKSTQASPTYTPSCSGTKSFKNDVLPLIQSNCVSCHSNYSTYAQISASASSIRSVIVGGSMPKGGSLTDDQKNNIVCWIDAGKLNN